MWRVIWALLVSMAITIGAFVVFWPSIDSATNTTVSTINATYPDSSNYTGLTSGIAFGPLLLWAVAIITPLAVFAIYVWSRRKAQG